MPSEHPSQSPPLPLAAVETMYGSLVETLPAVVYVAEPTPPYETIYISPGIEILGYSRDEWLMDPRIWVTILHPEDRERVLAESEDAYRSGGVNDHEYRVFSRDGSVVWVHDRGRFVLDGDGSPLCWQGVLVDITARKAAEQERDRTIRELSAALAEVEMLSGLLPICAYCKRVRSDRDYWETIESFISARSSAQFSHGICPDCFPKLDIPEP